MRFTPELSHDIEAELSPITNGTSSPYHALLYAILVTAVLDYLNDSWTRSKKVKETDYYIGRAACLSAREFFAAEGIDPNSPPPFSFPWIAHHLSDDPDAFMHRIRSLLPKAMTRTELVAIHGRYIPGTICRLRDEQPPSSDYPLASTSESVPL
jgi:hypothetical protein